MTNELGQRLIACAAREERAAERAKVEQARLAHQALAQCYRNELARIGAIEATINQCLD